MADGVYHPSRYERRRDERVHVRLRGRLTSPDSGDLPCATLTVSAGGLAVQTAARIPLGEHVVCHFEQIGRVEAVIVGHHEEGVAVSFVADRDVRGDLVRKVTGSSGEWRARCAISAAILVTFPRPTFSPSA